MRKNETSTHFHADVHQELAHDKSAKSEQELHKKQKQRKEEEKNTKKVKMEKVYGFAHKVYD